MKRRHPKSQKTSSFRQQVWLYQYKDKEQTPETNSEFSNRQGIVILNYSSILQKISLLCPVPTSNKVFEQSSQGAKDAITTSQVMTCIPFSRSTPNRHIHPSHTHTPHTSTHTYPPLYPHTHSPHTPHIHTQEKEKSFAGWAFMCHQPSASLKGNILQKNKTKPLEYSPKLTTDPVPTNVGVLKVNYFVIVCALSNSVVSNSLEPHGL